MNEDIKKINDRLDKMEQFMNSLKSSTTIPFEVDGAFRKRLLDNIQIITSSSKAANSEDVFIDEAGSSTKTVLNDPTGFLQVTVNGVVKYIPYY